MAEIHELNAVDASNTGRWPENMLGGAINNAGRADEGILARWYQDMDGSRTASGSSNAFAVTSSRTIGALFDNLHIVFTANHSNTGAATLNLNGLGAKSLRRANDMNVIAGDIVSGQVVHAVYKSSIDRWLLISTPSGIGTPMVPVTEQSSAPSTPSSGEGLFYGDNGGHPHYVNDSGTNFVLTRPLLHVRDEKSAGTDGGTFTQGAWRTRTLNTTTTNEITGASLSSNQITLPAGTYQVFARAPGIGANGAITSFQARLRNATDGEDIIVGASVAQASSGSAGAIDAIVQGQFTLAAQKALELQHQTEFTLASTGLGRAADFGVTEVYSEVMIWKVR